MNWGNGRRLLFKAITLVLMAAIIAIIPFSISFANSPQPEFTTLGCQTIYNNMALLIEVEARGLVPHGSYWLSLEGKAKQLGNRQFREWNERTIVIGGRTFVTRSKDFKLVRANSQGELTSFLLVDNLPKGKYNLNFIVKTVKTAGKPPEPVLTSDNMIFEITGKPFIDTPLGRLAISIISATIGGLLVRFIVPIFRRRQRPSSMRLNENH